MYLYRYLTVILLLILSLSAQSDRAGSWQISFIPQYTGSQTLDFGSKGHVDFNDRSGWGLGIGYNLSGLMTLDLNFMSSTGSYNGTVNETNGTISSYSGSMYSSSIDLAATYNIIDDDFTPYLSINVGSSFIDSGIPTGNYYGGTCYDPWSGYYYPCYGAETHTTVTFHYGAGAGLRYDFKNRLFVKGGLNVNLLDFDTDTLPYFITYQVTIGTTFK